ncbi:MAG TPA: patatin-like phospholipase family protein [Nitrospiria bacterium]|nr:patatin-like phospholipase family protein [Nitrospiria bacterium]
MEAAARTIEAKAAMVFSGGGARGAYNAGVAMAFAKHGVYPEIVSGTSVGALVAAMVVAGEEERLCEIWRHLTPSQVYGVRSRVQFFLSFIRPYRYPAYSSEPLARLIQDNVALDKIRQSPRKLIVTCYNQTRHRVERFDNHCPDLTRVLLASTSIPLVFPPVEMNGQEYVDLGSTVWPLKPAISAGAERIYAVLCDHPDDHRRAARNNLEWAIQVMNLSQRSNMLVDIELARRINLTAHGSGYKFVDLTIIQPSKTLGLGFMDFHKKLQLNRALEMGYEDATAALHDKPVSTPTGSLQGEFCPYI